ncbi:unnamed protein product [Schistosoma margrebowiei]|uniref:Uncharacterized protein n=1 Tax=Schistosoma margrebowiei TaxID=48269 RepID=A0A3P8BU05_9TREM|nr:unnamed protein product [Schistosoma margrebowiei]
MRELVLPVGFDLVSPSFTVRDVATELSEPRLEKFVQNVGKVKTKFLKETIVNTKPIFISLEFRGDDVVSTINR